MKKYFISLIVLTGLLIPVNSWALAKIKYDIYSPGSGYSLVHGDTSIRNLVGTLTGYYDYNTGWLHNITGSLTGDNGTVQLRGGWLRDNGSGVLAASVHKGNKSYYGGVYPRSAGYFGGWYDNQVSDSHLKIWAGGWFKKYKNDNYKGWKWLGLDLYGVGHRLSEPGTIALFGLGALVLLVTMRRKKVSGNAVAV